MVYEKLPASLPQAKLSIVPQAETEIRLAVLRKTLCDLGYQEVVTYSFVNEALQTSLNPHDQAKKLLNPMSSDMEVMRTSLWPGLINTLLYNQHRQQKSLKLFETGLRFTIHQEELLQQNTLSGLNWGQVCPEQWGVPNRLFDFFDLKGDVENLISLTLDTSSFKFEPPRTLLCILANLQKYCATESMLVLLARYILRLFKI